jgi:hypothetical protein
LRSEGRSPWPRPLSLIEGEGQGEGAGSTRHADCEISQPIRERVEEIFGWTKTVASFRKTRFRGQARTLLAAHLVAAAYDLLRIAKLMPA